MKKVYGLRNCSCGCRGLVSGQCYRTRYGIRRKYFHNRKHVARYIEKQLNKVLLKYNRFAKPSSINKETNYFIKHHLERVNVIQ